MTTQANKKEGAEKREKHKITFICKFCGMSKPIDEMRMITRFFPPLVACRDCEAKLR